LILSLLSLSHVAGYLSPGTPCARRRRVCRLAVTILTRNPMLGRSVRVRPDRSGFWKLCGNDGSSLNRIRWDVFVEDFFVCCDCRCGLTDRLPRYGQSCRDRCGHQNKKSEVSLPGPIGEVRGRSEPRLIDSGMQTLTGTSRGLVGAFAPETLKIGNQILLT
jgi:hypothetical protein